MSGQYGNLKKKIFGWLLITLACSLFAALALRYDWLIEIESRTWDWRLKAMARPVEADSRVKIIVVDQSSLDHFSNEENIYWPWPRALYEAVVKYLQRAQASGIAFDVLYTEPSAYGVDDDKSLASAFSSGIPVVTAVALRQAKASQAPELLLDFKQRQTERDTISKFSDRYLNPAFTPIFKTATLPIRDLIEQGRYFGNVSAHPDPDGIFRHYSPGGYVSDIPVLGLPFALYDAVYPNSQVYIKLNRLFDDKGRLTVKFHGGARTYKTYGIDAIIRSFQALEEGREPLIPLAEFKDSLVFVGMDAPGLLDLRPTPLGEVYPGVEYNATVLDNLLHQNFISKVPFPIQLAFACLIAALAGGIIIFLQHWHFEALLIVCLGGFLVYGSFALGEAGYWIQMVVPGLCLLFSVMGALAFQYQLEGRQHKFIKDAFKHYVSPSVIEKIVEDPTRLSLGGEKRELTIFFSDIQGFTSLSESIEPTKLVGLLNLFLSAMTDVILRSGGTVDKYVGDAIVAFWNAPLTIPDHAARAVKAALECQKVLTDLQAQFERDYKAQVKMRIGLNTGIVSVGNFGSKDRFNYTMIGDAANLASRLEGANKFFGTFILISGTTRQGLGDLIFCRKIADIRVVGKAEVVTVFEPLPLAQGEQVPDQVRRFEESLAIFERGDLEQALSSFSGLGKDPVARVYITRISRDIAKQAQGDAEKWSPVWVLNEK